MNINKYFLQLPQDTQKEIVRISSMDQTTDNKILKIYYLLYPEHIDYIHTDKRYEAICNIVLKYVTRINYYNINNVSFGQYLRSLDKKLGLLHFGRLL